MPVLPLVGSSSARPGWSSPEASAASIIATAMRSLIEPVGFCPSSFAKTRAPRSGRSRSSWTSGVSPIRSSSEGAVRTRLKGSARRAACHRGQENGPGRVVDLGVEAVQRADVFADDVHVDERGQVAVLHDLAAQTGEAVGEVDDHLAHGAAVRDVLLLAAGLGAERRGDAYHAHVATPRPALQNST